MHPLLAQVSTDLMPGSLEPWLKVFFWLVGCALGLAMLYRQFRPAQVQPQPLVVSAHPGVATADELRQTHGRISREREEIDKAIEAVRTEYRTLSDKIDRELKDIRQAMDDVPERTIDLLRKTKDLI